MSTALGTRIDRAITEITALDALATPAGATLAAQGTLDKAAALRTSDYTTYDAGEFTAAGAEKVAADAAVKARTTATATDGGPLTEAKELA